MLWNRKKKVVGSNYSHFMMRNDDDFRAGNWVTQYRDPPCISTPSYPNIPPYYLVGGKGGRSFYGSNVRHTNPPDVQKMPNWNPPSGIRYTDTAPHNSSHPSYRWDILVAYLTWPRAAAAYFPASGMMAWVSGDQFASNRWLEAGGAADDDFQAEAIYHLACHNITEFLHWNTERTAGNPGAGEIYMNKVLRELDYVLGASGTRTVLATGALSWADSAILSGIQIETSGYWRFTPSGGGSIQTADPFTFLHDSGLEETPVTGAHYIDVSGTMSTKGYWLGKYLG